MLGSCCPCSWCVRAQRPVRDGDWDVLWPWALAVGKSPSASLRARGAVRKQVPRRLPWSRPRSPGPRGTGLSSRPCFPFPQTHHAVELLDHTVILFCCLGTAVLGSGSLAAVPFYIPSRPAQGFHRSRFPTQREHLWRMKVMKTAPAAGSRPFPKETAKSVLQAERTSCHLETP